MAKMDMPMEQENNHHEHHHHHHHHHDEEESMSHHKSMMMPTMTFHLWTASSQLLFKSWTLDTAQALVVAMLFSAALSIIYEGSKFYYHLGKILHHKKSPGRWDGTKMAHYVSRMWKAIAYTVHFAIGYVLMLCAMTFNVWVLVSVCLGAGISYFFLVPTIMHVLKRSSDNVHRKSRDNIIAVSTKGGRTCQSKLLRTEFVEQRGVGSSDPERESCESETFLANFRLTDWTERETVI